MAQQILKVKAFPRVRRRPALDQVQFDLNYGEVHALVEKTARAIHL